MQGAFLYPKRKDVIAMGHIHSVYDSDLHFAINPITRGITNMSTQKNKLIQYDHNSERFTFEIPRYVEGHDMSTCNVVEIHYLNIDADTGEQNEGVYPVDDLQISPEDDGVVICSWLISQNTTRYVGSLNFLVRFVCISDILPDYVWNTAVCSLISVSKGMFNSSTIAVNESDILAHWQKRITALEQGVLDNFEDGLVVTAVQEQNNLENLMFWSGTAEEYEQQKAILPERTLCMIVNDNSFAQLQDTVKQLKNTVTVLNNSIVGIKNHVNDTKGVYIGTTNGEGALCASPVGYDYFIARCWDDSLTIVFHHIQRSIEKTRILAKSMYEESTFTLIFNYHGANSNTPYTVTLEESSWNTDYIKRYDEFEIYGFKYPSSGV